MPPREAAAHRGEPLVSSPENASAGVRGHRRGERLLPGRGDLRRGVRAGRPCSCGQQYTSFAFTAHLLDTGTDTSIGTVGDALDNALMEHRPQPAAGADA